MQIMKLSEEAITGGFSGAEIVAICRESALSAIQENEEGNGLAGSGTKIGMRHLLQSIKTMRRQITPEMLEFYASYREGV